MGTVTVKTGMVEMYVSVLAGAVVVEIEREVTVDAGAVSVVLLVEISVTVLGDARTVVVDLEQVSVQHVGQARLD